jgi:hypothetical protein
MIDYSAFDEKNVKKYNGKLKGLPKLSSPITALIIVSAIPLLVLAPALRDPLGIILAIVVVYVIYRLTWNGRDASIRSALFADRNGFNYSWQGGKLRSLQGIGSVLGEPMMSNVVSGFVYGQNFKMCGIYSDKLFKQILLVSLPNKYPHIILDAKQNDMIVSSLHRTFPDNKEFVLEGNFPDYFRVFSATTPVETLQILSPDLMVRLIDYPKRADIEIIGDQLLLICNFKYVNKNIFKMLFESAEQILKDLGVDANNSRVKFDSESRI